MIDGLFGAIPNRPAGDVLSRVVRIDLGGQSFVLPVLRIGGNRRWKQSLDGSLTGLIEGLTKSGDDMGAILGALSAQTDTLLDLLISYDETHVLPSRADIEEIAYETDLVSAVREVWRAANPLVVAALESALTDAPTTSESSPPTNTPLRPTAGRRPRSKKS